MQVNHKTAINMNSQKIHLLFNRLVAQPPKRARSNFRKKLRNWKSRYRDWRLVRRGEEPRPKFTLEVDSTKHIVTRKFQGGKNNG